MNTNIHKAHLLRHIMPMLVGILMCIPAMAQDMQQRATSIRLNEQYLCGDGYADSYEAAKKQALNDLMTKISVKLTSNTELVRKSGNDNGQTTYSSDLTSTVSMYTQGTLTNTHSLTLSEGPDYHVFCYMSREELDKLYAARQDQIDIHIIEGFRALEKNKVDVALNHLYWALALVKSLQYPEKSTFVHRGEKKNLETWLPAQMQEILEDLSVKVADYKDNTAILHFKYKDQPLRSVQFEYWDGMQYSMTHRAKDGMAEISLRPGTTPRDVRVRYVYGTDTQSQGELMQNLVKLFGDLQLQEAEVGLMYTNDSSDKFVTKEAQQDLKAAVVENNEIGIAQIKDYKSYDKSIQKVMKAIETGRTSEIRSLFTDEGWEMMDKLLHYGKAKLLGHQEYSIFELNDGRVTCRSLTMSFAFPNNHKTFTEDVVFTFDQNKQIEGVTFGLGTEAKDVVFDLGLNAEWSQESMFAIVDFLENYQTAFAMKRLDYLESIFDDYAYIVTGHVVKRAVGQQEGMKTKLSEEMVEYTQYSKEEYIKKLKKVFANNEYVNLTFTDNDVQKMGEGGELFAIQIHQDYYSSRYGDTGYLFLLVDINNPKEPIIKVRTWQPTRNPDMHPNVPKNSVDYGIVTAGDF